MTPHQNAQDTRNREAAYNSTRLMSKDNSPEDSTSTNHLYNLSSKVNKENMLSVNVNTENIQLKFIPWMQLWINTCKPNNMVYHINIRIHNKKHLTISTDTEKAFNNIQNKLMIKL